MSGEEFKKLYIKYFGIVLSLLFVLGEIAFVNFLYPKREFSSAVTGRHFYEYITEFSGKLTPEKEKKILAEQERIVDAENAEAAIEKRLFNGEYSCEDEFVSEYNENHLITERKEAFDLIFEQYSYALEAPNDRYLTMGNYNGLGTDVPDILMSALVILMTATLFLSEESSGVITFIRISANGKEKTLCGKLSAISLFIVCAQIFRALLEFVVMISRGGVHELFYPLRTLEYFENSPYDISILQGFITISVLRLLGYFFIAALVILLSVTIRKALFTIFIPSAACVLQQFAFNDSETTATPAYYLPTGLLRGVGYLRGDVIEINSQGEEIKIFSQIPLIFLIILIILSVVFIIVSVIAAYNYYSGGSFKKLLSKAPAIAAVLMGFTLSGCNYHTPENVSYNLLERSFFAQNDDYFYISSGGGIVQISKHDSSELELIHNVWDEELNLFNTPLFINGDKLYYLNGAEVYGVSLEDYGTNKIYSEKYYDNSGFLGVSFASSPDLGKNLGIISGFFTYGGDFYFVYGDRILKDGKRLFDDEIFNGRVCFDGRRVYYINRLLELKSYDLVTGENIRLPGEFVRAVYCNGPRLLYSDKNGIFALDTSDNSSEKLSDQTADRIDARNDKVVFKSGGSLYLLSNPLVEIYNGDLESFAVSSDGKHLIVVRHDGGYDILDL
ncbi:MAG: hypothetical protein K2J77_00915 [Oscillospiraceae bacterium]|nr:hypothetical protein [Oscillospiraceae bacterium]